MFTIVAAEKDFYEFAEAARERSGFGNWKDVAQKAGIGTATLARMLADGPSSPRRRLAKRDALAAAIGYESWSHFVAGFEGLQHHKHTNELMGQEAEYAISLEMVKRVNGEARRRGMTADDLIESLLGMAKMLLPLQGDNGVAGKIAPPPRPGEPGYRRPAARPKEIKRDRQVRDE